MNEVFVKFITTGQPFVILKAAASLDGKIATRRGESQWISSTRAREKVHQIRNRVDAILVGTETVLKDNPRLTTRLKNGNGNHPVRVVLAFGYAIHPSEGSDSQALLERAGQARIRMV